jgi:hypothetical protein
MPVLLKGKIINEGTKPEFVVKEAIKPDVH